MMKRWLKYRPLLVGVLLLLTACRDNAQTKIASSTLAESSPVVATDGYEIVKTYPHDRGAFTQGLVFQDGFLYESTGRNGTSSLRKVELQTGKVLQKADVDSEFFAEGMTILGEHIYQLTWQAEKGFVYDLKNFQREREFAYTGEGWGLTHDGESLIMSDGSNELRFLDPKTFSLKKIINVYDHNQPLRELNELEYVKGEIYANIWHSDKIVRIDPRSGKVLGWIDLHGLLDEKERGDVDAVLNGIAYDAAHDRLFVTGKLWPKLFEIKIKRK